MPLQAVVAVAYSGGRDSTALLHATAVSAAAEGWEVVALHVHHGLSRQADEWLAHCRSTCEGLQVDFRFARLDGPPSRGESIEAWARRERYRALTSMAHACGASAVLLGHHQRDQAETVLLQALRGAGVAGLSGMPRQIDRDGLTWMRPWLDVPAAAIDDYVARHSLRHIDDDSNADVRFARNRLRLDVWPALSRAFTSVDASLSAAASWSQQASELLAEVAADDLAAIDAGPSLDVARWLSLSPARRSNALRAWIARVAGKPAPATLVQRLLVELPAIKVARWPLKAGELRCHRGQLRHAEAPVSSTIPNEGPLIEQGDGRHAIPGWKGVLLATRVDAQGLALDRLSALRAAPRQGGEQFQLGGGRPARSLKKQFQSLGLASWERDGPLLFDGDRLVFVAGLGIDARAWARPGEVQVALRWVAGDAKSGPG